MSTMATTKKRPASVASTDEVLLYLHDEVDKFLEGWEKLGFPTHATLTFPIIPT